MTDEKPIAQFDFEYFVDLSPDLICIAGDDGYFKRINPAFASTLGYSTDELLASPINTFIHPEDRELTSRRRTQLFKGKSMLQFQNRYLTKMGKVVRLFWTCVHVERDGVVFAIAKDVSQLKFDVPQEVDTLLKGLDTDQMRRFEADLELIAPAITSDRSNLKWMGVTSDISNRDQLWLNRFEQVVRQHIGHIEISLAVISSELAIGERQLFRQVKRIMEMTPSQLVRIIRFHIAWEAIASKKYHSLEEISAIAGYASKKHFRKSFVKTFGIDVMELL